MILVTIFAVNRNRVSYFETICEKASHKHNTSQFNKCRVKLSILFRRCSTHVIKYNPIIIVIYFVILLIEREFYQYR